MSSPAGPRSDAPEVSRANGEAVFWAGGCVACHGSTGRLSSKSPRLGGGRPIVTEYGTFHAPNISSDVDAGIGAWSLETFDRAMRQGRAPDGHAYYPTFPYPSYARMPASEIADLYAYMQTVPAVDDGPEADHVPFPVNLPVAARSWQRLYLHSEPVAELSDPTAEQMRGQSLVEGAGRCGSCHTPRNMLGGPRPGRWLAGATMPDGSGFASNLTPHEDGLEGWTQADIVEALRPADLSEGGYEGMAAVRSDLARLPESDLEAIAAYLLALEPVAIPARELD